MGNCQTFQEDDVAKAGSNLKGRVHLVIKADTWLRDSYGLFDYENTNIVSNTLRSYSSGKIVRAGTGVSFIKQNEGSQESIEKRGLFQVQIRDGNYWIGSSASQQSLDLQKENAAEDNERDERGLWAVVKTLKEKNNIRGCQLTEGDLIKLGRIKMRVVEQRSLGKPAKKAEVDMGRRAGTEPDSPLEVEGIDEGASKGSISGKDTGSNICRICLSEAEVDNPLFSPCKCSGTMKHVHIKCLQTWLNSKLNIKEMPQVTSYFMKSFECELCKTLYPNTFEISGVKYDVIDVKRPKKAPYLILEVLGKDGNMLRGLHMIRLDKKNSIKLGRGHESDIRISDISVSRYHASIKMDKDGFYLEDINSKFGTLIYMRKSFPISGIYENVSVQIGRTVANFCLKKNWKLFSPSTKNLSISQVGVVNEPTFIKREVGPIINKERLRNVPASVIEINERSVRIPNRGASFQPRNNRDSNRGPQRPLGGDDDLVEIEEAVYGNNNNNIREQILVNNGGQGRDIEVVEVLE